MNISMMSTYFLLLPDIVLLEIFTYLSFEDVLYAFADIDNVRLINLLTEHGAFRQICLSSQLSLRQYEVLSAGIWRYDLVRSFICKEIFSDFLTDFTPCQIFTSLTDLRVLFLRYQDNLEKFVIAHSSTLTHLSLQRSEQSSILEYYETFLHTVLPHLNRLKLLDTDWTSCVSIQWSRFENCLQSLEHLSTYMTSMSDVYVLAVDGVFPRLKSLRILVEKSVIKTVSSGLPATTNLHMPNLESFDLYLGQGGEAEEGEEQVKWTTLETLTSHSVMPRLRRYSLIYTLETTAEVGHIFQSFLFNNDERHIRVRFGLYLITTTAIDSSDTINICNIRSTNYNKTVVQYNHENESQLHYTWFTSSWPRCMQFHMDHNHVAPRNGVRDLGIKASNILLHSIGKLFSNANELTFEPSASLSMIDSSLTSTPLINIRHLTMQHNVVPGVEFLLDGIMLPHLQSLRASIVPLFVAFARRANQMKTLDTINHIVLTDQYDVEERCFSLKQWCIVLSVLPRLRTLLIQLNNPKCPPMGLAELFIDYIKRTIRSPLTIFSCCIHNCMDQVNKEHFVNYLLERIQMECSRVQFMSVSTTGLDMWM